jgi:DNA-directed RNA polymerase specialized sigma24 family protein
MGTAEESVTHWLAGLKNGESICARRLYGDVYDQLVGIAKRRLSGKTPRWADEEDVALSAFHSFCKGAAAGKFPRLENRDDLWKLLVKITSRKAKDYLRTANRLKRGGGEVRGESVFMTPGDGGGQLGLDQAAGDAETPEMVSIVAEECRRMLDVLGDDTLKQIAVWKVEGHTDAEIAAMLGCVVRTVERKMERIREKWAKLDRD